MIGSFFNLFSKVSFLVFNLNKLEMLILGLSINKKHFVKTKKLISPITIMCNVYS